MQKNVFDTVHEPVEYYDKLKIVIIYLNDQGMESGNEVIGFLSTLLSTTESAQDKKKDLEHKYHIAMTRDITEGVESMCNIGEAVEQRGIEKGILSTLTDLIKKGLLTIEQAVAQAGMTVEEFRQKSGLN